MSCNGIWWAFGIGGDFHSHAISVIITLHWCTLYRCFCSFSFELSQPKTLDTLKINQLLLLTELEVVICILFRQMILVQPAMRTVWFYSPVRSIMAQTQSAADCKLRKKKEYSTVPVPQQHTFTFTDGKLQTNYSHYTNSVYPIALVSAISGHLRSPQIGH